MEQQSERGEKDERGGADSRRRRCRVRRGKYRGRSRKKRNEDEAKS